MTYDEFIAEYKGRVFDYGSADEAQCVEILKAYLEKVFGIAPFYVDGAKDFFIRFERFEQLNKIFIKIYNTPEFIPIKGDICVWGSGVGNGQGYVSIATGDGSVKHFYGYDSKHNGKAMKRVRHNYRYFLGVLRAKDQSCIRKNLQK